MMDDGSAEKIEAMDEMEAMELAFCPPYDALPRRCYNWRNISAHEARQRIQTSLIKVIPRPDLFLGCPVGRQERHVRDSASPLACPLPASRSSAGDTRPSV